MVLGIMLGFLMFVLFLFDSQVDEETAEQTGLAWVHSLHTYNVLKAMTKLGLIMGYFFLCDRSELFLLEIYAHM